MPDKPRLEGVAPEMRCASDRTCAAWGVEEFAKDLGLELSFDDESVAGLSRLVDDERVRDDLPRGQYVCSWFRRLCVHKSYPVPGAA